MTVEACYTQMGANYIEVRRRLGDDERIIKFLGMLYRDDTFASLSAELAAGNYEAAFRAAHTLKGVVLNMSLTRLSSEVSALTEALRDLRDNAEIDPLFQKTKQTYQEMMILVGQLLKKVKNEE